MAAKAQKKVPGSARRVNEREEGEEGSEGGKVRVERRETLIL